MLEITESATDVLRRAYAAAARFNPDARVRISRVGGRIETGFSEEPQQGDEVVEHEGLTLFVAPGISGTLDTTDEHDRLIVR